MTFEGGMGIAAVKNLSEEGFNVTGFESSPYVGGLWHYTDDEETLSVLKGIRYSPPLNWFERVADDIRYTSKCLIR